MKGLNSTVAGAMNFTQDSNNPIDSGYAYSNALLGVLDQYTESSSRFPMYEFNTTIEWYLQDTWKVSHNLTIDVGLRWGWGTPWHANHNQEAAFVPSTWNPQQVAKLIQPDPRQRQAHGTRSLYRRGPPRRHHWRHRARSSQPINGIVNRLTDPGYPQGMRNTGGIKTASRLGFAWDPFGKGKTVIRTGGGIFYNFHEVDNFGYGYEFNTPPLQYNPIHLLPYPTQLQQARALTFPPT